jgi:MscS family membrane protein
VTRSSPVTPSPFDALRRVGVTSILTGILLFAGVARADIPPPPAVEPAPVLAAEGEPAAEPSAAAEPSDPVGAAVAGDPVGAAVAEEPSGATLSEDDTAEGAPPVAEPVKAKSTRRRRTATERWIRQQVPDDLERPGPFDVEWWQWLAFPLVGLVSAGFGRVTGGVARSALDRLVRATTPTWDDELLTQSRGPLYLLCGLGVAGVLVSLLYLRAPAQALTSQTLQIGLLVAIVWVALRAIDIAGVSAGRAALAQGNVGTVSVLPLVVRSSKIALVVLGLVTVLSALGYPVTSLLAGLGIGGLALALAAQKTAENVFGSVSLGVDQPLRVGDLVKVEDLVGNVEAIGLRSTRIRTADRTLVTLPNGRLADMRIENFTVRDRMRVHCVLGLEFGTSPETIRAVLAGIEGVLLAHPKIWSELVQVRFTTIGATSLDISVSAWFLVNDPDQLLVVRQELMFAFLEQVEACGARFAFPTQTVHLVREAD